MSYIILKKLVFTRLYFMANLKQFMCHLQINSLVLQATNIDIFGLKITTLIQALLGVMGALPSKSFEVQLPDEEQVRFITSLKIDHNAIVKAFVNVDVTKAEGRQQSDNTSALKLVEDLPGGS